MPIRIMSLVLPVLLAQNVLAQTVYKCRQANGQAVFSDVECGQNPEVVRRQAVAPARPASAAAKRDLVLNYGNGDSVTIVGGEGQFHCNDPAYAGKEIRQTYSIQGAGMSSLCEEVPEEERLKPSSGEKARKAPAPAAKPASR